MRHEMLIPDASGHLTLTWSPTDPESVAIARAEFERLKALGYAFYVSADAAAGRVVGLKDAALSRAGALDVRPDVTREFQPRRRRTVAMRPLVGG